MSKRVLVTGATGFIGQQTVPYLLSREYEVHALTIKNETIPLGGDVYCHEVDIFDYEKVGRVCRELEAESLLHLAWHDGARDRMTSPKNLFWVEASINLVRAFSENGGNRIVLAGSCAEYNWQYGYCNESLTPTEPDSLYGESKNTLHRLIFKFCQGQGIRYSNGRIFFVYGPREAESRFVPYIAKSLLMDQVAEVKNADLIRDYLHVSDVANALVTLLDSEVTGAVNIGSGHPTRLGDLAKLIAEKMQKPGLIAFGSTANIKENTSVVLADTARLRDELGWRPNYDLEQGLEATIEWWKEQNKIMIKE